MIRFPNPGSNLENFIRVFDCVVDAYPREEFGLDDITRVLVEHRLVTSSGYTGRRALAASTRKNRSRDPLYNQSKMYAELFRLLGWLCSSENGQLRLLATPLGRLFLAATTDKKQLYFESLLGITFPPGGIEIQTIQKIRPFKLLPTLMASTDGLLCRDEMILGPLSIKDDSR